jgi:hypothetical protein
MWKIYTQNATGIAIQSSIGGLAKSIIQRTEDSSETTDFRIEPIKYDLDCIKKIYDEDDFNRFQHKLKAYKYEQEIRALITLLLIPTVEEPKIGFEVEVDLDILIHKIFISHRLDDSLDQFVRDILNESHLDKEVVKPSFMRTPKY